VTHASDRESILLCEAAITTDILDALENLKTAVLPMTWPTIYRKTISYKPYDTFAVRLEEELVAPGPSNDAIGYQTKRGQEFVDGGDDGRPRKIRRILDT
jgi:hypothetical protein